MLTANQNNKDIYFEHWEKKRRHPEFVLNRWQSIWTACLQHSPKDAPVVLRFKIFFIKRSWQDKMPQCSDYGASQLTSIEDETQYCFFFYPPQKASERHGWETCGLAPGRRTTKNPSPSAPHFTSLETMLRKPRWMQPLFPKPPAPHIRVTINTLGRNRYENVRSPLLGLGGGWGWW